MTRDPVRLFEDPATAESLRLDLGHAAADQVELHGLDLVGGLAKLQSATATVTASTTVVAGSSLLVKAGIGAGLALGVALWLGLGGTTPELDEGDRVAAPVVSALPQAEIPPTAHAPALARVPAVTIPPRPEPEPEPEPKPEPVIEPATAEPEPATPEPEARHRETRPRATPEPARADASDSVLREAKLVAKARSKLARDPERALSLAEQAERDFPRGQLVEERRALAIQALVALGRSEEAERRATPFLAEYGRGAHAAAVRRALAHE